MGRLSTIAQLESRARSAARAAGGDAPAADAASAEAAAKPDDAAREEDFHGISTRQPLGRGHTVAIVLAVLTVAAAVGYVLNYWFHFV